MKLLPMGLPGAGPRIAILRGILTRRAPIYIQFSVTDRCNLKCRMCRTHSRSARLAELSLPEIDRLAEILREMGVGFLVLTGGEPLLREDLPEIVRIFTRKGIPARLQTNGLLATGEAIRKLVDSGLAEVTVSLDSLDPAIQDRITGMPGSFEKIMRALHLFSGLLPNKGNLSGINTVVSRLTLEGLPALVRFATEIGFLVSLIPLHHSEEGEEFTLRGDAPDHRFTEPDFGSIDSVYSELLRLKEAGALIFNSRRFLRESPDYLKYRRVSWRCDSPDLYFSIGSDGTFRPCVDRPGIVSMLDGDFLKNFPEHRRRIRSIAAGCPGCMYGCYPEVSRMCRSFSDGLERLRQGARLAGLRRPATGSAEDFLARAVRLKDALDSP